MIRFLLVVLAAGASIPAASLSATSLSAASLSATAQDVYEIVPERSEIGFSVDHMGLLTVHGVFHRLSGRIVFRGEGRDSVYAVVDVETASIDTGNHLRDRSLATRAFLDEKSHPTIRYEGRGVMPSEGHAVMEGTVRIRGETFVMETDVELARRRDSLHVETEFSILRSKAGLSFESSLDPLIGDELRIVVRIVAERSAATSASRILQRDVTRSRDCDASAVDPPAGDADSSAHSARLRLERCAVGW